jgi:hypothetical protein
VNTEEEAAASVTSSGEVETTNAEVVVGGGGRIVVEGGEPDIDDTRLIGLRILRVCYIGCRDDGSEGEVYMSESDGWAPCS